MPSFLGLFGANPDLDSLHPYETSWLLSPGLFAGLRALIGVYLWVTIILIYSWDSAHGETKTIRESFSYFTYLNLWGMAFYFLVAFVHTILYARTGRSVIFNRLPRFFRALHSFFYTCNTTLPILVLIVYWSILYSNPWFPEVFTAWQNISQHGLIALFALFEIILSTAPPHPLLHIPFLVLILLGYLAVAYITHYTQGFYTYSFFDPGPNHEHNGKVVGYIFGILVAILVIYGGSWLAIWTRRKLCGGGASATDAGKIKRSRKDPEFGGMQRMIGTMNLDEGIGEIDAFAMENKTREPTISRSHQPLLA